MDNEKIVSEELMKIHQEQVHQIGAVDMRILALTNLLLKKGFITEHEIKNSYIEILQSVKAHGEKRGERDEKFEAFIEEYLQIKQN